MGGGVKYDPVGSRLIPKETEIRSKQGSNLRFFEVVDPGGSRLTYRFLVRVRTRAGYRAGFDEAVIRQECKQG